MYLENCVDKLLSGTNFFINRRNTTDEFVRSKLDTDISVEILKGKRKNLLLMNYKWRVLVIQGDRALLLSEDIIDRQPYHKEWISVTWETSALRHYLNGEFYARFSSQDQTRIIEVVNRNMNNQWSGTRGGNNTSDKVFLLSLEEVVKYFGDSGRLWHKSPEREYWIDDIYNGNREAKFKKRSLAWWLRSPGEGFCEAVAVAHDGSILMDGFIVDHSEGVRPALWLNLRL